MKIIRILILFLLISVQSNGQIWKPYGSGFLSTNSVDCLFDYNQQLYACGAITGSGANLFKGVAKWDGNFWTSLSSGIQWGIGSTMTMFNGDLIAGGDFTIMNSVPNTKGIARWDGNTWFPLGSGITDGTVYCMQEFNGKLYIGGRIQEVDGMNLLDIASWDGTSWDTACILSLGLTQLNAMAVYNNELIIGGYFSSVNGVTMRNIAKFNGTSWDTLKGGVNSDVFDLFTDTVNNRLYAVGNFNYADLGNVYCPSSVAYWDGTDWHAVGVSDSLWPRSITSYNNEIYVGFTHTAYNQNGDTLNAIARWDGADWQPLGNGLMYNTTFVGNALSLITFNNELAVGGGFTKAGDSTAFAIASWTNSLTNLSESQNHPNEFKIYPNPAKTNFIIKLPDNFQNTGKAELFNASGDLIYSNSIKAGVSEIEIDLTGMAPGMYFYQISNGNDDLSSGKFFKE